jgi:hypothetical protein
MGHLAQYCVIPITTRSDAHTEVTPRSLAANAFCYTDWDAFARFARHAVVPQLDQIHLRISCPPFIEKPILKSNESGMKVVHVYLSV